MSVKSKPSFDSLDLHDGYIVVERPRGSPNSDVKGSTILRAEETGDAIGDLQSESSGPIVRDRGRKTGEGSTTKSPSTTPTEKSDTRPPSLDSFSALTTDAAVDVTSQKPAYHAAVHHHGSWTVYSYTVSDNVKFSTRSQKGQWPILQVSGCNYGVNFEGDLEKHTETFRRKLSQILHGDHSEIIPNANLKEFSLVIADNSQRRSTEIWVKDALGSISVSTGICQAQDLERDPSYLTRLVERTSVYAAVWSYPPFVAGYLTRNNHFVCFFMYGESG